MKVFEGAGSQHKYGGVMLGTGRARVSATGAGWRQLRFSGEAAEELLKAGAVARWWRLR